MSEVLKPVSLNERLGSLDFLRGVAVLGILVMNIEAFSYPYSFHAYASGFESPVDRDVRFWVYLFFQGKFFSVFALLFGVGFYIFMERMEVKQVGLKGMDIFARRLFWLFVFGLVHAIFIWSGDILYHYAVCGLLLFPFRSFKTVHIIAVIVVIISTLLYKSHQSTTSKASKFHAYEEAVLIDSLTRTDGQQKAIDQWLKMTTVSKPDGGEQVAARKGGYLSNLQENLSHVEVNKGNLFYSGIVLRTLLLMLLGVVFYRWGIFADYRQVPYYWLVTVLVLSLGIWVNYIRSYHWTYEYYQRPVVTLSKAWVILFCKEVLAIGYILFFNGAYQKFLRNLKVNPLASVGRMALTNYIGQSVICAFIFYGFGFGLFNELPRRSLLWIVGIIWFFQIGLSSIWMKYQSLGPLEYLWRKLNYHPFGKEGPNAISTKPS